MGADSSARIIAAAAAASPVALWLILTSSHEESLALAAVILLLVCWAFVAAGLVARARVPGRFGSLMCAVGLAAFLASLGYADDPILFTIGLVVGSLWIGILVHALVAFPAGRLGSRVEVAIVAAAYTLVTAGQVVVVLFDDLADECPGCPEHEVLIRADDDVAAVLDTVVGLTGAAVALAVIAVLVARWRGATPPLRRALAPVLTTGGAAVAAIALIYASSVLAPEASEVPGWLALAFLAAFPFAFLAGLLRMQLDRTAVGRLVVELGETPAERELRDALRRALHDPELTIAYARADGSGFVDSAGRRVELPAEGEPKAAALIERRGDAVAALIHDASLDQDPELIQAVVAAAGLALENERLQAELRARLEDLHASRARIVEAQASERRRLERNLHDGAQQRLVSLALALGLAEARAEADPAASRAALSEARSELGLAIEELREIARGIHPALLTDRGLAVALDALAGRTPLPVAVEADLDGVRLPEPVEVAAYYVAAEALTNVVKYARASRATVRVGREGAEAVLEVADDGIGGADPARGSGLRGLVDRVEALDGRLDVLSPRGGGTRVRASFPLGGQASEAAGAGSPAGVATPETSPDGSGAKR